MFLCLCPSPINFTRKASDVKPAINWSVMSSSAKSCVHIVLLDFIASSPMTQLLVYKASHVKKTQDIIHTADHQLNHQAASPSLEYENLQKEGEDQWPQYNKRVLQPLKEFLKRGKVFVKPKPANKHQPWIYGKVIGSMAPRSCNVSTLMGPVRRNHTQIREAKVEPENKHERADDHLEIILVRL